jgi:hypothetical protein
MSSWSECTERFVQRCSSSAPDRGVSHQHGVEQGARAWKAEQETEQAEDPLLSLSTATTHPESSSPHDASSMFDNRGASWAGPWASTIRSFGKGIERSGRNVRRLEELAHQVSAGESISSELAPLPRPSANVSRRWSKAHKVQGIGQPAGFNQSSKAPCAVRQVKQTASPRAEGIVRMFPYRVHGPARPFDHVDKWLASPRRSGTSPVRLRHPRLPESLLVSPSLQQA